MAFLVVACAEPVPVNDIYWSDGDSGRYDGVKFRLADVDAPETGGVGSWGGAKCESERELGYAAKAFMVELTRTGTLEVIWDGEIDNYDRRVVDIRVNGEDIASAGMGAGHLRSWIWFGGEPIEDRPEWC